MDFVTKVALRFRIFANLTCIAHTKIFFFITCSIDKQLKNLLQFIGLFIICGKMSDRVLVMF